LNKNRDNTIIINSMISYDTFCEFITSYHPDYNGHFLRPLVWCSTPQLREDGYVRFSKREYRDHTNANFYAKHENNEIIINVDYCYNNAYFEQSSCIFKLIDYKKNTYNFKNIHNENIPPTVDEEIMTFIKQFDHFLIEEKEELLTHEEYEDYILYLAKFPNLIKDHKSKYCEFNIEFSYDNGIVAKFEYYDKKNNKHSKIDFVFFKTHTFGDDFYDIDLDVHNEIINRFEQINYNIMFYFYMRL